MKVNVDGKEMEVLTADEAKAKADEAAVAALETYKAEHPDQSAELTKLQGDLKKAQDDLKVAEDKGGDTGQVRRLREERDKANEALTKGIADLTAKIDSFQNERQSETKEAILAQLAGTDKALREKILIEFNNYKPNAVSNADIRERLEKAFQLANGGKPAPKFTDNISGGGSRGDGYVPPTEKKETENGAAMRKVFGITDEQVTKGREILKKIGR